VNVRLSNLHLSYGQRHVLDGVTLVGVPVFVSLILTRHRVFGGAS